MENKILEKELNENYESHEIFLHQSYETLNSIEKIIDEKNEILLEINMNNIMPYYNLRTNFKNESDGENNLWDHIISILFMTELKGKYNIDLARNIDEEKRIMTKGSIDTYLYTEDLLSNRSNIINIIRELEIDRIHIIIRHVNNEFIWKELFNYFDDELGFITMIYSDSNIGDIKVVKDGIIDLPTNLYSYKSFIDNNDYEISNGYKNNIKKKVLINEKKI